MGHADPATRRLAAPERITVVSGLPRAGTSLAMQLLAAAGLEIAADAARPPDPDNPRGYLELSAVKGLRRDAGFLPSCRGRAVKIVAPLLLELPRTERYRVLFLERDIDEVLVSQRALLARAGHPPPTARAEDALAAAYRGVVARCRDWLAAAPDAPALFLEHRSLFESPDATIERLLKFLEQTGARGGAGAVAPAETAEAGSARAVLRAALAQIVEPGLYRSRAGS